MSIIIEKSKKADCDSSVSVWHSQQSQDYAEHLLLVIALKWVSSICCIFVIINYLISFSRLSSQLINNIESSGMLSLLDT